MKAWFDISAGVAGDMLLGALLDAGADVTSVQAAVDALVPGAVRLDAETVTRAGQRATKAHVRLSVDDPPHRTWRSIRDMLAGAALADETRQRALAVFGRLAEAEGRVHGINPDEVHFHEVGALDSIADVVGSCEVLRLLGVDSVSASPVSLGAGRVRAAHGDIPVPVPAVAELTLGWQVLATDWAAPTGDRHAHAHGHGNHSHGSPDDHSHGHDAPAPVTARGSIGELATPTGMAFVRALAATCEPLPSMTPRAIGVGAGGRDTPHRPNVVRVILGESTTASDGSAGMVELRCNVDDLDPRLWPGVVTAVLSAGAVDCWLVDAHMKKGRPGIVAYALAPAHRRDEVIDMLLRHTSTLGVRWTSVERTILDRIWRSVDVEGEPVEIKIGSRDAVIMNVNVEFESVAAAARRLGRSEADVAARAGAAAVARGWVAGSALD